MAYKARCLTLQTHARILGLQLLLCKRSLFLRYTGTHTGENIGSVVGEMLDEWSLRDKVHVIVRDNTANMTKALDGANVPSIGCFVNTVQQCIQKPLESKQFAVFIAFVGTVPLYCRPFSHSVLAKERLKKIQEDVPNQPKRKLVQDVSTHWNLTYYMVKRPVERKKAVVSYEHEYGFPGTVKVPEKFKFGRLRELAVLLKPIEAATRDMCRES